MRMLILRKVFPVIRGGGVEHSFLSPFLPELELGEV